MRPTVAGPSTPAEDRPARPPRSRPPTRAERLLSRVLPAGIVGETILGDLHQELDERCMRSGPLRARLWYWAVALELAWAYRSRVRRGLLPYAFPGSDIPSKGSRMSDLLTDLRYGFRMLRSHPLVSTIAALTIAVGVGMTVYTFSTVYGSVLRGLPLPDDERLMMVRHRTERFDDMSVSLHDFLAFRDQVSTLAALGAVYQGTLNLAGDGAPPERYRGAFVSANALSVIGVPPLMGRVFVAGEEGPDADPVLVISHDMWRSRFGSDPRVIGRRVRANGLAAEIVGVMPPGFRFPFNEDAWIPFRLDPAATSHDDGQWIEVFGYLGDESERAAADEELAALGERLRQAYPDEHQWDAYTMPYEDAYMPPEITAPIKLQLLAVAGVLLIACANVANLLLARSTVRQREVAVRTALGASRWRVIRQLMVETLVIAAAGGVVGLGLAKYAIDLFNAAIQPIFRPYWIDVRLDVPALLTALAATLIAALVSGLLPALRATGQGASGTLREDARGSSLSLGRLSSGLVIAEIAVSATLLVLAGLTVKSVLNLNAVDLGFRTESVLTARIGMFTGDYPTIEAKRTFLADLRRQLRAAPGIESAALTTHLPGLGAMGLLSAIDGQQYPGDRGYPRLNVTVVSEDFFETLEVPLREGRTLRLADMQPAAEPVTVVSESLARQHFPAGAIDRSIRIGRDGTPNPWMRIVGVVGDTHVGGGVGGLGSDRVSRDLVYVPMHVLDVNFFSLALRTDGAPVAAIETVRTIVAGLDGDMPVYDVAPLDQALEAATWAFDLFSGMFAALGGVALFLSTVGLYGVMAFNVARRTREVGIRMALGAEGMHVLWLVTRRGAGQLAIGLTIGLAIGALASQPLAAITFGVQPGDPGVFIAIFAILAATGMIATLLPARRATRVDPSEALRSD